MRNLFIAAAFIILGLTSAQSASATATWSLLGTIAEIDMQTGYHGVWIITDVAIANDNCSGTPGAYFLPDESYSTPNPQYKSSLALVMAAYMNNRNVAFYVSGCTSGGNPLIQAVRVQ